MTKRKLLNQNVLFFLISLLGLFIFSCKNPLAQSQENQLSKETVKLKISTNLARTVLPTQFNAGTSGLTWTLTGIKDGASTSTRLGSWSDEENTTAYSKMTSTEISVDVGTWNFTLDVTNSSDKKVLTGTTGSIDVSTSSTLTFVMQEPTEGVVAPGQIEFKLNFPSGVVGKVEATLTEYGNVETPVGSGQVTTSTAEADASVTYTNTVSAGTYMLKLDLKQQDPVDTDQYRKINTYTCLIRVAPGLLSSGSYELTSLAELYPVTFVLNGGYLDENTTTYTVTYNKYQKIDLLEPRKNGCSFDGWYTDENCDDPVNLDENGKFSITEGTTLYAKWQEQQTSPEPSDPTNGLSYFSKKDDSGANIDCLNIHTDRGLALYRDIVNGTLTEKIIFYKNNSPVKTIETTNTGRIDAYLMADITVEDWIPIGIKDTSTYFEFEGNKYTITINSIDSSSEYVGVFGYVGNATATSLKIKNLTVAGTIITDKQYAGGIVAYSNGATIENCVNKLQITGNGSDTIVGGIVGYSQKGTVINNCVNFANLTSAFVVGGIVGTASFVDNTNYTLVLSKCINLGQITGSAGDAYISGMVAKSNVSADISNCINIGQINVSSSPTGGSATSTGFIYLIKKDPVTPLLTINNCINTNNEPTGYVTNSIFVGNSNGTIDSSSNLYYDSTKWASPNYLNDPNSIIKIGKTTAELCNLKAEDLSDGWSFAEEGEPLRYPLPNLSGVYKEAVWSAITSAEEVELPEIEVPSTEFVDGAYYVSDSGSDSSNGLSAEASYKTLKKAISSANNSDENRIIYVTGTLDPTTEGIEKPSTAVEESNSVFYIQESGFTNQIQIIGYNDAIFSGNNATRIFSTRNSYNFKFKNITFQNANTSGSGGAFYYSNGILELENCNFRANVDNEGGSAIYVYGGEGQLNLTQTNCEDNIYASSATVTINDDCIIGKEGSTNRITLDRSTLILNGSSINIFESVYIKNTDSKIKIGEKYVHGEDKIKIMIAGSILSTNFLLVQECSESIKEYFEVISEDGEKTYTLSDEGYVSE